MDSSQGQTPTPSLKAEPLLKEPLLKADALPKMRSWSQTPEEQAFSSGWRDWLMEIPLWNRTLIASGTALIGLALLQLIVPPVYQAAALAARPYTASGKRDICQSNLKQIGLALLQYGQDYNETFPPLEYQSAQKDASPHGAPHAAQRVTWFSLLAPYSRLTGDLCPQLIIPAEQQAIIGAYGYNPVLAGRRFSQVGEPALTIMAADRGTGHHTSLLPPFSSWPKSPEYAPGNMDFRHKDEANVLYADGHVKALSSGAWVSDRASWGGDMVAEAVNERQSKGDPAGGLTASGVTASANTVAPKTASTVMPGQAGDEREGSGLPYLDTYPVHRLLDDRDIRGKNSKQIWLMRNAIFARRGRPFLNPELRQYFGKQSWYHLDSTWRIPEDDDRRLSSLDAKNARFLARHEPHE
jgi:prepilin-type processing-associated H-X9-DG protein